MCDALTFAHSTKGKIVHRDITPGNILLGGDNRYKLSDFGLSVQLEGNQQRVTSSNWISPGFSPPEQYRDFANADERSDVFSLAATIFYMCTGVTHDRPGSPTISEPLCRVLEVCLDKIPDNRPKNGHAAAQFLNHAKSSDLALRFPTLRRLEQLQLVKDLTKERKYFDGGGRSGEAAARVREHMAEIDAVLKCDQPNPERNKLEAARAKLEKRFDEYMRDVYMG
jgi:serine/threonine protein kinase